MVSSSALVVAPFGDLADPLQLWMEHSSSAIAFFDREMRYLMANRNWIVDYSLVGQDIIGRCHYDVFPEIGDEWKAIHQRCLQGATEQRTEDSIYRADGSSDWIKWDVHPWHQSDGKIGGIVIVTEMITKRKQAELALLDAQATLKAEVEDRTSDINEFFNLAADILAIAGFDGYFKRINPVFSRVLGYSAAELKSAPFLSFVHPEDQDSTLAAASKLAAGGKVVCFENRYRCRDGSYRWLSWTACPNTERELIYANVRDVTEQRATAAALRKQAQLLEQVKGSIISTDLGGRITSWSQGATDLYGYTTAEALGQPISLLYPEAMHDYLAQAIIAPLQRQGQLETETRNCDRTGREFDVLLSLSLERDETETAIGMVIHTLDISDRKQAQHQLEQEQSFLRALLDNLTDGIMACDRNGVLTLFNQATREFYGISAAKLLPGQWASHFDLYHGDGQTPLEMADIPLFRAFNGEKVRNVEIVVAPKQGTARNLLVSGQAFFDEAGDKQGAVVVMRDITARKQNEHLLQQQQAFLSSVFEGSEHCIFVIDVIRSGPNEHEFRFSGWNRATEENTGVLREQVLGNTPIESFGPEYGSRVTENYRTCYQAKTPTRYEETTPFQGQELWWLTTLNPLMDATGNIYRLIGTTTNITERKQAEIQLQAYADRQALLNQVTTQIRRSLNLETVIDNTLRAIQQQLQLDCCAFAWYSPELDPPTWEVVQEVRLPHIPSILGPVPMAVVGPIDHPLLRNGVLQINQADHYSEPIHRDFLHQAQTQSELLVPVQAQSDRIGVVICTNQSEHHWSDSEVVLLLAVSDQLAIAIEQANLYHQSWQKSQELEQALQELQQTQVKMIQAEKMSSLGQLVAGVAHEINNPINFIFGNLGHAQDYADSLLQIVELYQTQFPEPGDTIEQAREELDLAFVTADLPKLLKSMKVGTERIRGIVSSLRVFSRMDEADMKSVDIHEGIDSTLMILQNRIKARHDRPEIVVQQQFGDLPQVECYAGQLNQVFMNLLSNAIDALEDALNRQRISEPVITIRSRLDEQGQAEIAIADNGPGIPEAIRDCIFDPFFTTKPVGKGTGMGLSISYQIIAEKHGGTLVCHSDPTAGGSKFIITIPQRQPTSSRQ